MKITNNHDYPLITLEAVKQMNSKYSKGDADLSVTELIGSPLISILKERHRDELVDDVSNLMFMFYGSLAHQVIENIEADYILYKEQRMFIEINNMLLSGQFDLVYKLNNKIALDDVKFTTKGVMEDPPKQEWVRQLNVYKYMFEETNEMKIDMLGIVAFARNAIMIDRIKSKRIIVPVYTKEKVKQYLEQRVAFHKICRDDITGRIPECTREERWHEPEIYAVMKDGGKRSLKNHTDRAEAEAHAARTDKGYIEVRPEVNKRCEGGCIVVKWCWAYNEFKETGIFPDSYEETKKL